MVDLREKIRPYWPLLIVFIITSGLLIWRLSIKDWDPLGLAEIGTRFLNGDPGGTEGYDGQFAYYIAIEIEPSVVSSHLDVPAYRYQRILYPVLARLLACGKNAFIPWSLLLINFIAHLGGTAILIHYLYAKGIPTRYSLIYGLWVGLIIGVGADLYEPLAFALLVAAFSMREQSKFCIGYLLLGLALFTKETALPFWCGVVMADAMKKRGRANFALSLIPGAMFASWQAWLWNEFGSPGIVSGGTMATPFEWIPFMGFLRIGTEGWKILGLYTLIFGPTVLLPSIWGMVSTIHGMIRGDHSPYTWVLLLNTLLISFLPFSTFREPLGLLRVATGIVLGILLFAVYRQYRRPLNYGMFWISLIILAFK